MAVYSVTTNTQIEDGTSKAVDVTNTGTVRITLSTGDLLKPGQCKTICPTGAITASVTPLGGQLNYYGEATVVNNSNEDLLLATNVTHDSTAYAPLRAVVHTDFTGLANGSAPTKHDSGQAIRYVTNGVGGAGATIASGRLTNTASAAANAAVYCTSNLGAPVKRVGAEFSFSSGGSTTNGAMTLMILTQDITDTFPTLPDASLHFVVTPVGWTVSFIQSGSVVQMFPGTFKTALTQDGTTTYRAEVQIEGTKCSVLMPDGSTQVYTDSRFASIGGNFFSFEVFENAANTDDKPQFAKVWADVAGVGTDRSQVTIPDLALASQTAAKLARPQYVFYTGGTGTANLPASSSAVDLTHLRMQNLIVPDSGAMLVEFSGFLTMVSTARVFWVFEFGGTSDWVTQEVYNGPAIAGIKLSAKAVLSGLSPGATVDLRWYHWSTVLNSGYLNLDNGGGHQPLMVVTPV